MTPTHAKHFATSNGLELTYDRGDKRTFYANSISEKRRVERVSIPPAILKRMNVGAFANAVQNLIEKRGMARL